MAHSAKIGKMGLKNQLTKTPYLVLFIVLLTVGVGTASAMITITLAGNVVITGDTQVDGDISIGTSDNLDDGFLFFDGGAESLKWEDFSDFFLLSDDLIIVGNTMTNGFATISGNLQTGGLIQASNLGPLEAYNRIGTGTKLIGNINNGEDLFVTNDLGTGLNIYAGNDIFVGTDNAGDDDEIWFDSNFDEFLMWDESLTRFRISDELKVDGPIIASPIIGKWSPNSPTSNTATEFVKFDFELINTESSYFELTNPGDDHVKVLKSGYYRVTVNIATIDGSAGEETHNRVIKTDSADMNGETLCRNIYHMAGEKGHSSCSTINFFDANDKLRISDLSSTNAILGGGTNQLQASTFLTLEKLN